MNVPIVMAAFGSTTRAVETYEYIDEMVRTSFPEHDIRWAYSSRMVKSRIKKQADIKHPHQVLTELKDKGHQWAVVQSLHLTWGHEFYRLREEAASCGIRTSMGSPLLTSPDDYDRVISALDNKIPLNDEKALVMVGHGTDHPTWSSYAALQHMFSRKYQDKVFIGVVEEGYPVRDEIIEEIKNKGIKSVRLCPFMLVAGVHFEEDLAGEEDSWKALIEKNEISVDVDTRGLGYEKPIIDIFIHHIKNALDIIPSSIEERLE